MSVKVNHLFYQDCVLLNAAFDFTFYILWQDPILPGCCFLSLCCKSDCRAPPPLPLRYGQAPPVQDAGQGGQVQGGLGQVQAGNFAGIGDLDIFALLLHSCLI